MRAVAIFYGCGGAGGGEWEEPGTRNGLAQGALVGGPGGSWGVLGDLGVPVVRFG